jgi:hypothetical protein
MFTAMGGRDPAMGTNGTVSIGENDHGRAVMIF